LYQKTSIQNFGTDASLSNGRCPLNEHYKIFWAACLGEGSVPKKANLKHLKPKAEFLGLSGQALERVKNFIQKAKKISIK